MAAWDNNSKADQWIISPEERVKHDGLFLQQNPIGGLLSADQVKRFFMQSGLPASKLGQIWSLADLDADGRMNSKEFSIAMHLIRHSLHGGELPTTLPPSLQLEPLKIFNRVPPVGLSPSFGISQGILPAGVRPPAAGLVQLPLSSAGLMFSMAPALPFSSPPANVLSSTKLGASIGGTEWAISQADRSKYAQVFASNDLSRKLYLTGLEARAILSQSNLQQSTLAQIWSLSDVDGNGSLTLDEFCVAMHLVEMAKNGRTLPNVLPLNLVPPCYRGITQKPLSNSAPPAAVTRSLTPQSGLASLAKTDTFSEISSLSFASSPVITSTETGDKSPHFMENSKIVSFEDKRRENFAKGQAELERRRAMLEEEKKKEAEERIAFERREEEKRERARLEQEQRRQLELEKQLAKQRKLEQEKEEQRLKAFEQKEAARRELERQRQLEWENQRREQLMSEKIREQASVEKLRKEVGSFRHELTLLGTKRTELCDEIELARQNIVNYTSAIEGMKTKRDTTLSDIDRFQLGINEWTRKLTMAENERIALDKQTRKAVSNYDDALKSLKSGGNSKRSTVRQLRADIDEFEQRSQLTRQHIEQCTQQLSVLKSGMSRLRTNIKHLEKQKIESPSVRDDLNGKPNRRVSMANNAIRTEASVQDQPNGVSWKSAVYSESAPVLTSSTNLPVAESDTHQVKLLKYVALFQFKAQLDGELSLNEGEQVLVFSDLIGTQEGWLKGKNKSGEGWFPESYVAVAQQKVSEKPPNGTHSSKVVDQVQVAETTLNAEAPAPDMYSNSSEYAATASEQVLPSHIVSATQQPTSSKVKSVLCLAVYDYASTEPDDLSFKAGDVINIESSDGEWWTGSIDGRSGLFPANYVKLQATWQPAQHRPTENKKPEIATVISAYDSTGPEQLSLRPKQLILVRHKGLNGWWEGELQAKGQKKREGWFPAKYVKLLVGHSTDIAADAKLQPPQSDAKLQPPQPDAALRAVTPESSNEASASSISSNLPNYVDRVIAKYNYQAQHDDELSFVKGVVINVISNDDPDWWQGEVDGAVGLFPSNYIQPFVDSTDGIYSTVMPPSKLTGIQPSNQVLSEIEQKRQRRIQELITTEETFAKDLATALEVFYKPLKAEEILNEEELNTLFINWKELRICSMKLLKALRVRLKMSGEGLPIQIIGDILCENLPHMTPYVRYCSCQLNGAALLQKKSETDVKFKDAHKKCCQNPRTMGMPLSSFLLKPMQRITKYPLLIEKILEHTPAGHPDHNQLQDAHSRATELCNQVNEGVREKENSDHLEWLQNHVNCEGLNEKLTFNSVTNCLGQRKYLHSGLLYKVKSGKELVGILFNDFLLLTQPQRPLGTMSSIFRLDLKSNAHFKMYRNPIFLNEVMVKKPTEDDPDGLIFHLSHVNRLYVLRAPSSTDRDSWFRKIEAATKQYHETEKKKREKAHQSKSDPYCEVSMGAQEHKTKVIQNSLNPKWNASMQFTIKDLQEDVLCITVYDRDLFSPNDFLGRTEIRVKDILKETKSTKVSVTKRLLLHEVESGEVVVKLNIQLFDSH